jgi:hypothetical protein
MQYLRSTSKLSIFFKKPIMKKATIKQQIAAWKNNRTILNSDGEVCQFYGFYDWFCKDSSLRIRAERLMPKVIRFVKAHPEIDLEKTYVFFKNNYPMSGPTYDDFRICSIEGGETIFTVVPLCSHSWKAEIWGRANGFAGPIKVADTFAKLFSEVEVFS